MATSQRQIRKFEISKAKLVSDFALLETPIGWFWEGAGAAGNLIARRPSTRTADTPVPGVTLVTERYTIIPGPDIYTAYFTSIPPAVFSQATASDGRAVIVVNLNREENV